MLTWLQEYEKRLLAKDQEFKLGQEAQERMRRDIARLRLEVAQWKDEAAAVKYLPAPTTGARAGCVGWGAHTRPARPRQLERGCSCLGDGV